MNDDNKIVLNYPFFDGERVIEDSAVVVENKRVSEIIKSDNINDKYFLMPCLIDAHTHMENNRQVETMLQHGIIATCDVSASASLIQNANPFTIISSSSMAIWTLNGKAYVRNAINSGAKYIKVLLSEPNLMMKNVFKDICDEAHNNDIKVAVHAVSVKAVRMSVDCGADILIHVPMKEEFPEELAEIIAEKGISVIPTLVMMHAYANSGRNSYKPKHYKNAENALALLYKNKVKILAGTDSNPGAYAPKVEYGVSLQREMLLLEKAGMKPIDVLFSATSNVANTFGITDLGQIKESQRAAFLLIEGRADKNIEDISKIKQIIIG